MARPLLLWQSSDAIGFMILTLVIEFETTSGSLKCLRSRVFSGIRARRRRRCTMQKEVVVKEVYGGCGGVDERGVLGDWV